jgi:Flp pilus assembly protein TadB
VVPRAAGWLRGKIGSPVRLVKSVFMATIGKDRGFAFWWLAVTAAVALAIGLLVAALVSPVVGIVAALVVGIWMLIRRSRSSRSRKTAQAHLAS